jgi:IS5 family transposase
LVKTLFDRFHRHLDAKGYIARGGQVIEATIVSAPKQRNSSEENEAIKAGKTPEGWEQKPAKNAQKDKDALWTEKHGKSYYGYKNHYKSNTGSEVCADSAYRSAEIEAELKAKGYKSHVHRHRSRNRPISQRQQAANTTRWRVRARVEHVFADQQNAMGGKIVRTIGIALARMKIGMMNLVYNMRRLVQLERITAKRA